MAITPRTVVRNPVLLGFFTMILLGAFSYLFSCPTNRCSAKVDRSVQRVATTKVTVATIEAAKTATSEHGWLGIQIQTLTPERANYAGVAPVKGVLVLGMQEGRPAQIAGFQGYDVVTHFNGKRVASACQLKKAVSSTAPGSLVPVRIIRDGKPIVLHPTLTDAEGPRGCGGACK